MRGGKSFENRTLVLALLLVAGAFSLLAFQSIPAAPGKPEDKKCAIEGRVVNSVTGEAVKGATLRLVVTGAPVTNLPMTESGEDGQFAFRELDPGSYTLLVERTGFTLLAEGANSNPPNRVFLALRAGRQVSGLLLELAPDAAISGLVLGENDEPVCGAFVSAFRTTHRPGQQTLVEAGGAASNNSGEFRISRLTPGSYAIVARDWSTRGDLAEADDRPLADAPESRYVPTYYPDSADMAGAVSVHAVAGGEASGVDIHLAKANTVRISGKVLGAPEGKQALVTLVPRDTDNPAVVVGSHSVRSQKDGVFEIAGMIPGPYDLRADVTEPGKSSAWRRARSRSAVGASTGSKSDLGSSATLWAR